MKPFERLGDATTPDGTRIEFFRHDGSYLIRADGVELMSSRRHLSEDRLAEVACEGLRERPKVRVLIGDALVHEDARLQTRINQLLDRIEASLKQALQLAQATAGNPALGTQAGAQANALAAFVIGRWQLFANPASSARRANSGSSRQRFSGSSAASAFS